MVRRTEQPIVVKGVREDPRRQRSAEHFGDAFDALHRVRQPTVVQVLLVVTHPHGDAQRVRTSGEPRIGEVVGRAGLAVNGERLARRSPGAGVDDALHHALYLVRDVRRQDAVAARARGSSEQLSLRRAAHAKD